MEEKNETLSHAEIHFLVFKDLIKASYSSCFVGDSIVLRRIYVIIAEQPEERELLSLKCEDSYIDSSIYTLPSVTKFTNSTIVQNSR